MSRMTTHFLRQTPIAHRWTSVSARLTQHHAGIRGFTTTPLTFKEREELNPTSTEYSKSGGGDSHAAKEPEAFDPQTTRPEEEESQGGAKGEDKNPLNMSPASKEANSGPKDQQSTDRSPSESKGEKKSSGGGSPRKDGRT